MTSSTLQNSAAVTWPQIFNLHGDVVFSTSSGPTLLDSGTALTITQGNGALASLLVRYWTLNEGESVGIQTGSGVEVIGGLALNGRIVISGIEIGTVTSADADSFQITFNANATAERVEDLLRALSYSNSAPTNDFSVSSGHITISLRDANDQRTSVEVGVARRVVGTSGDNTFLLNDNVMELGDELHGGAGNDTLQLEGGFTFHMRGMASMTSVETILGGEKDDHIEMDSSILADVQTIDLGGQHLNGNSLTFWDTSIDLSGKTINNVSTIMLWVENTTITLDDLDTALRVNGTVSNNDTLILNGPSLSDSDRLALHHKGIDTVVNNGVSTTHTAPVIGKLHGDVAAITAGGIVRLDVGANATVSAQDELLSSLSVFMSGAYDADERISLDTSGNVKVLQDGTITVNDIVVGQDKNVGGGSLSITFNDNATPELTAELLKAVTYQHLGTSGALSGPRQVLIQLVDEGQRETLISVVVDPPGNQAPREIRVDTNHTLTYVTEHAPVGTVLDKLYAADEAPNDLTFSFVEGHDGFGRFTIDPVTKEIKVNGDIDWETSPGLYTDDLGDKFYRLKVVATEPGEGGLVSAPQDIIVFVHNIRFEAGGSGPIGGGGGTGTVNQRPTGVSLSSQRVDEFVASGTKVGDLAASDPDANNSFTFALVNDAGGRFRLSGDGKSIEVADGLRLDHEQMGAHTIRVRATDQGGLSAETDIAIAIANRDPESIVGSAGDDVFHGGGKNDRLFGAGGHDRLVGHGGRDTLKGDAGNDVLFGGTGKDKLYGGKGKASRDTFVFDTKLAKKTAKKHVDKIYDFGGKCDKLFFDDAAFANKVLRKLGRKASEDKPLKLKKYVAKGSKAEDKNDFFLFTKNKIYFDADGSGEKYDPLLVATYKGARKEGLLSASDFFLI